MDNGSMERVPGTDQSRQLENIGWVSYVLHLAVAVAGVVPGAQLGTTLLFVALVIDLVKRSAAAGTWQASHFSWRIRSVIWAGVLYALTAPLFILLYVPGFLAWGFISLWFLYRIVRGALAMSNQQELPR
jgi:uncharacterized membrane protein